MNEHEVVEVSGYCFDSADKFRVVKVTKGNLSIIAYTVDNYINYVWCNNKVNLVELDSVSTKWIGEDIIVFGVEAYGKPYEVVVRKSSGICLAGWRSIGSQFFESSTVENIKRLDTPAYVYEMLDGVLI